LQVGDTVELAIDAGRRSRLRRAHSATHLLHAALRRHLGNHVTQKGSLVAPDRLRFDFSHPKPVTAEEQAAIEAEVNFFLRQNDEVTIRLMDREAAIGAGAMALFGEKYGDEVRVVRMGREADGRTTSTELCGGTHARRTGDIALFEIVSESAVAAGIRRIEALTGDAAYRHVKAEERLLSAAAGTLKVAPDQLPARILALVADRRRLEQELSKLRQQSVMSEASFSAGAKAGMTTDANVTNPQNKEVGGVLFVPRKVEGMSSKELRGIADQWLKTYDAGVVAVVSVLDGKASLVVSVSKDLTARIDAVALVRTGVAELGGKGGGGRPDFAQGGGPDGARADAALAAIERDLARHPAAAE
jgi:alanyl-tRNA synthetase